jgi:hypothetical protein
MRFASSFSRSCVADVTALDRKRRHDDPEWKLLLKSCDEDYRGHSRVFGVGRSACRRFVDQTSDRSLAIGLGRAAGELAGSGGRRSAIGTA